MDKAFHNLLPTNLLSYFNKVNDSHISGKGAAVFAEGLSGAVASGLGKVRYLN